MIKVYENDNYRYGNKIIFRNFVGEKVFDEKRQHCSSDVVIFQNIIL